MDNSCHIDIAHSDWAAAASLEADLQLQADVVNELSSQYLGEAESAAAHHEISHAQSQGYVAYEASHNELSTSQQYCLDAAQQQQQWEYLQHQPNYDQQVFDQLMIQKV